MMRALAIVASLIVGWFATVLLVFAVLVAAGAGGSILAGVVGQLAAVAGGVGLAVLVARLLPRRKPRRRIDPSQYPNRVIRRD